MEDYKLSIAHPIATRSKLIFINLLVEPASLYWFSAILNYICKTDTQPGIRTLLSFDPYLPSVTIEFKSIFGGCITEVTVNFFKS